MLVYLKYSH